MADNSGSRSPSPGGKAGAPANPEALAEGLLRIYEARDNCFGRDLFTSPGWKILLTLQLFPEGLPFGRLRADIGVSASTLQRWLNILVDHGLLSATSRDGLQMYGLTDRSREALAKVLQAAAPPPRDPLPPVPEA